MPETVLWTNTTGGNNHKLILKDGELILTVVKSDGVTQEMRCITNLSAEDWKKAFKGVGPNWNETNVYKFREKYKAKRTVPCCGVNLVWLVDHDKQNGTYVLNDSLGVFDIEID